MVKIVINKLGGKFVVTTESSFPSLPPMKYDNHQDAIEFVVLLKHRYDDDGVEVEIIDYIV